MMTFEKVQEQQNTEIVDLKLKGDFSRKQPNDVLEKYEDQINELKSEIRSIKGQAVNLNINGLEATFLN